MTQLYQEDGTVVPVTAVLALPNVVTQVKSTETKDGYNAVQVGFGVSKKPGKAQAGHLKDLPAVKTVREFRVADGAETEVKRGDVITVEAFVAGDAVNVTGTSKGKGFQGVVKRHGFHGSPKTHGHKDQERMPGSIGAGGVQRVFKGVRMAGHMGDEQVTVSGLEVVAIDAEKNILYVKGALPGARHSLVMVYGPGKMTIKRVEPVPEVPAEKVEEAKVEAEVKAEAVPAEAPAEETKIEEVKE